MRITRQELREIARSAAAIRRGTVLAGGATTMTKRSGRLVLGATILSAIAGAALFAAQGIASLVEAMLGPGDAALAALGPHLANGTPTPTAPARPTADAVLDRNPFDHVAGSLRPKASMEAATDLIAEIPACENVRPVVIVATGDRQASFAAFEVDGKRVLRKQDGEVGGLRIRYIGPERVWFEKSGGSFCYASLFSRAVAKSGETAIASDASAPRVPAQPGAPSAFEKEIAGKIVKKSDTEYEIDRPTLDRILEAQTELMKARVLPEKDGDRVIGVRLQAIKPGSVLSLIGLQNNDRLETVNGFNVGTPEEALTAYARLRAGADRLTVRITRGGKTMNLDYAIR